MTVQQAPIHKDLFGAMSSLAYQFWVCKRQSDREIRRQSDKLDSLRSQFWRSRNPERRASLQQEMDEATERILDAEDKKNSHAWNAVAATCARLTGFGRNLILEAAFAQFDEANLQSDSRLRKSFRQLHERIESHSECLLTLDGLSEISTDKDVEVDGDSPNKNSFVAHPSDPSGYIPQATILADHTPPEFGMTDADVREIVEDPNNQIRWTRPYKNGEHRKNRRLIHLADWWQYWERHRARETDGSPVVSPSEVNRRQESVRSNRSRKKSSDATFGLLEKILPPPEKN